MSVFLIRILLIIAILLLVRRIVTALSTGVRQGRSPNAGRQQLSSDTVRDPVCGMYLDRRVALRIEQGKGSFFFCSKECKEKFFSEER